MKLNKLILKNFRGYRTETSIDFENLTVFVGKNDVGKSTLLEALDIFFNDGKGAIKIEKEDISSGSEDDYIIIGAVFSDLPDKINIDATNDTTLRDEHLLNKDGYLEIIKKYPKAGKAKIYIKANHPNGEHTKELLLKKSKDLQKIVKDNKIECDDERKNAKLRKAIWQHFSSDLNLQEIEIDASKEDAKNIWDKLHPYMPLYVLFQSDRTNNDNDSEVQDPMKVAVNEILKAEHLNRKLDEIANEIKQRLEDVANTTLDKLREMNPEIAEELKPVIPDTNSLKWAEVFKKVTITSDNDIPLNKRGSGIKRLILLNFFRAEAERRKTERNVPDIIYAIEEPETSQHIDHQNKLIDAFTKLSNAANTQIILTTHSSNIVKMLSLENLKIVIKEGDRLQVKNADTKVLSYLSVNEVNFIAFDESTEEYQQELYNYLKSERENLFGEKINKHVNACEEGYKKYIRKDKNNKDKTEYITLHKYIRNQIHHPENKENERFNPEDLMQSIEKMRELIKLNP